MTQENDGSAKVSANKTLRRAGQTFWFDPPSFSLSSSKSPGQNCFPPESPGFAGSARKPAAATLYGWQGGMTQRSPKSGSFPALFSCAAPAFTARLPFCGPGGKGASARRPRRWCQCHEGRLLSPTAPAANPSVGIPPKSSPPKRFGGVKKGRKGVRGKISSRFSQTKSPARAGIRPQPADTGKPVLTVRFHSAMV